MRWILALLTASLLLLPSPKPSGPKFGGTFIGAVVAEDGVVVAADSRSTFLDGSGRRMGYLDGLPKVFVGHGAAFAVSGLTSVNGELFSSFVRRNDFLLARPVDEMLFGVALWLPFKNTTSVLLISAGFRDGAPMICAKSPNDQQECRRAGYISNKESASLRQWNRALRRPPKASEAAAALREAILEVGSEEPTVGGPISILHLRPTSSPQWLENTLSDRGWTMICDIIGDYRRGKIQIVSTGSQAELDHYLAGACP